MKSFLKGYGSGLTPIPSDEFPRIDVDKFPRIDVDKFPRVDAKEILTTSDIDALRKDWEQVGKDIEEGIRKFNDRTNR